MILLLLLLWMLAASGISTSLIQYRVCGSSGLVILVATSMSQGLSQFDYWDATAAESPHSILTSALFKSPLCIDSSRK
jgi:hypothetical protein